MGSFRRASRRWPWPASSCTHWRPGGTPWKRPRSTGTSTKRAWRRPAPSSKRQSNGRPIMAVVHHRCVQPASAANNSQAVQLKHDACLSLRSANVSLAPMFGRRALMGFTLSSFAALPARAAAKDELVIGTTQAPGTMNPLISQMLATSLVQNMRLRPFTAYDPDWKLVGLACTKLPSLKEGTARLVDLPDGKQGIEVDIEIKIGRAH